MKPKRSGGRRGWIVGVGGAAFGAALVVFIPKFEGIAGIVVLVALFHILGAALMLMSAYELAPARAQAVLSRLRRHKDKGELRLDFGWSFSAMNMPWALALAFASIACGFQMAYPLLWPVWFAIALLAVNLFISGLLLRTAKRSDWATLPLVDLLSSDHDQVLDAGCGAGRTTIALSGLLKDGRITAFDRFDASYIDGGGKRLLERNLEITGLSKHVRIEQGDLTDLPFPEGSFDSAVSAHVIDHLGKDKVRGLKEIFRVLKPGGRFLLVVWVPGWALFAVANLLCLFLTWPGGWRRMARHAGFAIRSEGLFNGAWYVLLEKPCPSPKRA